MGVEVSYERGTPVVSISTTRGNVERLLKLLALLLSSLELSDTKVYEP